MKKAGGRAVLLLAVLLCTAWIGACQNSGAAVTKPVTAAEERDQIYMMTALAVVDQDWQTTSDIDKSRGYNIGSVLVDPSGKVVYWGRNCVNCMRNGTQHGEVRLMEGYQTGTRTFSLKGYSVYTSLEPCAMCGGMMCQQSVARTVYGQMDPDFGYGIQRLALNSTALGPPPNGYLPYPRVLPSVPSTLAFYAAINASYAEWRKPDPKNLTLTKFLATPIARALYKAQTNAFLNYSVVFPENMTAYQQARKFYTDIPNCPSGTICCDVKETPGMPELPVGQHTAEPLAK